VPFGVFAGWMEAPPPAPLPAPGGLLDKTLFRPQSFDLATFDSSLQVMALKVPAPHCERLRKILPLLQLENVKQIQNNSSEPASKLLLLAKEITGVDNLPATVAKLLETEREKGVQMDLQPFTLALTWRNYSAEEIMRRLVPAGIILPSSFEIIGHIAHLNLHAEQLPYKRIIGEALVLKVPAVHTVVNKTSSIETEFRTFPMEVLAGVPQFETEVRESGCRLRLNYAEVYWNSRLQMEHRRLVDLFKPREVIWDMFAGIGPFAVPAAKKRCVVFANDLNPRSFYWLNVNAKLNHVQDTLTSHNLDAREFIRSHMLASLGDLRARQPPPPRVRVIMNLPALGITFLDVLREVSEARGEDGPEIVVHCYNFSNAENPRQDVIDRSCNVLGVVPADIDAYEVRDVSPKKFMLCISFTLPTPRTAKRRVVATTPTDVGQMGGGTQLKKARDEA
jgi:tRNA (guanine37-N1)-methyltransferase